MRLGAGKESLGVILLLLYLIFAKKSYCEVSIWGVTLCVRLLSILDSSLLTTIHIPNKELERYYYHYHLRMNSKL